MWKCKECGNTTFYQKTEGVLAIEKLDKEGNLIKYYEETSKYGLFTCWECGKKGKTIKNIAKWEEY